MTLYHGLLIVSALAETVRSQRSNLLKFLLSHCLTTAGLSLNFSINFTSLYNASGKPSSNPRESWYQKAQEIVRQHDPNNPGY